MSDEQSYTFPSKERAEEFNRAAEFSPQVDDDTKPYISVGGVQVYAYLHAATGTVRVSIDLDDPDPSLLRPDSTVPLSVTCQGNPIFEG